LALTAVAGLLRKFNIDPSTVGRLEVGTESIIDKAKSVKSVLTQLFPGNATLEGVDTINACYGGTSAFFNAINWVESRAWDGRDAIVVASDIAIYKNAAARPTGGAGCVAMLIGPNAPLAVVPGLRGTFMTHAFDFYKPDLKSEYPLVDGQLSISCYLSALDGCYKHFRANAEKAAADHERFPEAAEVLLEHSRDRFLDIFDFMAFHTPNCKLVSKSYARLAYNDYLDAPDHGDFKAIPAHIRAVSSEDSLKSKEIETSFIQWGKPRFDARVKPSIVAPAVCGNMYTASLYCSLLSLISNVDSASLQDKTIGMFSYGSGIASSLFMFKVVGDVSDLVSKIDLNARLESRHLASPEEYEIVSHNFSFWALVC
jgi:hydroxymethylglutaryl-CoA synthase